MRRLKLRSKVVLPEPLVTWIKATVSPAWTSKLTWSSATADSE
ncbi:MAG: hypothetical protein R3E12_04695 [Candidatus Eisenbacteria bacterium]